MTRFYRHRVRKGYHIVFTPNSEGIGTVPGRLKHLTFAFRSFGLGQGGNGSAIQCHDHSLFLLQAGEMAGLSARTIAARDTSPVQKVKPGSIVSELADLSSEA